MALLNVESIKEVIVNIFFILAILLSMEKNIFV